ACWRRRVTAARPRTRDRRPMRVPRPGSNPRRRKTAHWPSHRSLPGGSGAAAAAPCESHEVADFLVLRQRIRTVTLESLDLGLDVQAAGDIPAQVKAEPRFIVIRPGIVVVV